MFFVMDLNTTGQTFEDMRTRRGKEGGMAEDRRIGSMVSSNAIKRE